MKTVVITFAALLALLVTPATAAAAPTTPAAATSTYVSVDTMKRAWLAAWNDLSTKKQRALCVAWAWNPKKTVRKGSKAILKAGYGPARNVKAGYRKGFKKVCSRTGRII
jgi:hypothetical protein